LKKPLTELVTFWGGTRISADEIDLIGGFDAQKEEPHTVLIRLHGKERAIWTLDWAARAITSCWSNTGTALILGLNGEISKLEGDQVVEEPAVIGTTRKEKYGKLLGMRRVNDRIFVVGYGNQVYRREKLGLWQPIDLGLPGREGGGPRVFGFEAIDGFRENDLYAVGLGGEIWHYAAGHWESAESPTNLRLTSLHCAPDGFVYVCGQHGLLMRGRDQQWEILSEDKGISFFWDVRWFKGAVYCASSGVLYVWSEGQFGPAPFSLFETLAGGIPTTFFRLSTDGETLLSVGPKDVFEFDGVRAMRWA
jgi:hypothetical protein